MEGTELQEKCDLCGLRGGLYGRERHFDILLCQRCSLMWTNPLRCHTESTGSRYWAEEVYSSNEKSQKTRFRRQLQAFLRLANVPDPKSLRVLEVGSGLGFFLDVCEARGIAAEGCDISEAAVRFANRRSKRVRLGTLDGHYKNESFHAVFAFNVVEHLSHPRAFFVQAHRVLKPRGTLIIELPIRESLAQRLAEIGRVYSKGRISFLGLEPGGHIYLFSRRTLGFVCKDLGFTCVYEKNINSPFREIWGKSRMSSFDSRFVFRLALPAVWAIARLTRCENRLFVFLQK